VLWGAAFIVVKPAFEVITPFNFLFTRYLLASVLCLPLLWYYGRKIKVTLQLLKTIVLLELVGTTFNLGILYLGLERTTAIETSLITTTAPLFIVILSILFLREHEKKNEWFGLILSFVGVVLITALPVFTNGFISQETSLIGNLLIVGANLLESIYYIAAKKQYQKIPKLFVASVSFIVGAITFGAAALWQSSWSLSNLTTELASNFQDQRVVFAVVYMAVFGSIIGLTAYIKGQNNIEASEASIFRYLQPLVYLPLGVIFLSEQVTLFQILGLVLILVGFFAAQYGRSSRHLQR
jgi:drug/metabolite transporter (DMT)-like permease